MKTISTQLIIYLFTTLLIFIVFNSKAQTTTLSFNTPGSPSNTWTCPPGVTSIKVECYGAGGAGGGTTRTRTGGGGGGGGAYAVNNSITVTPGNTYTITVGAGGVGSTGIGSSGGTSLFGTSVSAFGGTGGSAPASTGSAASGGSGGTGGIGGTSYFVGGNGSNSTYVSNTNYTSGSGGGGAGSLASGNNAIGTTGGNGGAADGGNGGNGFNQTAGAVNGNSGLIIGGGGSGAIRDNSGTSKNGGNGANGLVRITYTTPPCLASFAQPTSLVLTPSSTNISGSFTAAPAVSGYLVVMTTTSTAPTNPVNGTSYTVGTSDLGGTIISTGNTTSFNATGLSTLTPYWFWVYSYQAPTSCVGAITYLSTSPLTNNSSTVTPCVVPTSQPTSLVLTPSASSIAGSFTGSATANGYLVIMTTTSTAPSNPINGTTYTAGANALGGKIISVGNSTTFNATGLTGLTTYWFWIYSYQAPTACSGVITYLTSSPLTSSTPTSCTTPSSQPTGLSLTPGLNNIAGTFNNVTSASGYLVVMTTTSTAPSNPVNGTAYVVGSSALGGTIISASNATSFNATGLAATTSYWFWTFAYQEPTACSGVITYVVASPLNGKSVTLPPCTSPSAQPTGLILTPSVNDVLGSFTGTVSASGYLIVMTTSSTPPSTPVNGTTYTVGSAALGGTIISASNATTFNATGLAATTSYWFWVFAYQSPSMCVGTITYLSASTTTLTTSTVSCGTPTNIALITSSSSTQNWSSLPWSLGHVPTACENVSVKLDRTAATSNETIDINLDVNITIKNFTLINASNSPKSVVFGTKGSSTFIINGNAVVECPGGGGNKFNRCILSNTKTTTINGNLILGRPSSLTTASEGHSAIGSTGSSSGQIFNINGNMTFNPRGYTTDEWTVFNFDKGGTQYIYNYTRPLTTDTLQPVLFEDIRIGMTNPTTLIMQGTMFDGYMESVGRAGLTIGVNSTFDLPANYSFNVISGGSKSLLKMLAGSKLRLGGDRSINDVLGTAHGVAGSNFVNGYNYSLDPSSTIEYYGNNSITQTIYNTVTYKNLLVTNSVQSDMVAPTFPVGTAHAQKITTGPIVVNTSMNINGFADVTLGALGSSTNTVQSDGPLTIQTDGGLFCNANVVSGVGVFTMQNSSTLGIGHAQGISPLGTATGNVQMTGGRIFNTTGNYLYNGIVPQITGTGLPASAVNDLTIDNPTTVTISNNQLVNGVNLLKKGTFDILTNKITINGVGTMNATAGKMKADQGIVEMKGTSGFAQNLSGNWFVNKTINILTDANTKGITIAPVPADTLLISEALDYGSVTNSTITTNDNLTLLSRLNKTANFGNATGNFISGKVNVERYMFARSAWRLLATPIQIATSPTVSQAWRENNAPHTATGYGTRITGPSGTFSPAGTLDDYTVSYSMKSYNSAVNNFTPITNANTTPIANTKGYYVFVRGDRSSPAIIGLSGITNLRIKGELRTGTQVFDVPANKFESFGNPYASRVDMRTVNKTNVANAFIVWNPNNSGLFNVGGYETYLYNATTGNYERVGDGNVRNNIESGEAIFVQSNVAGTDGSFTVKETDKGYGSVNVSRPGITLPSLDILLYAQNPDSTMYITDGIKMNFDSLFTADVDNNDVRKVTNTYDNIGLKNGSNNLIVERRGHLQASDTIRFNMSGMRTANYRLDIDPSVLNYPGLEATFVDKFLNTRTPVSFINVTKIDFKTTADVASKAADRFMIVFKAVPSIRFTNIAAVRNADKTVKVSWSVDNEVNVENYNIEQSNDGINFVAVGLEAATINNGGIAHYAKANTMATENKNWYRIKANSAFGAPQYSAIALVSEIRKGSNKINASITIVPTVVTDGQVNVVLTNQIEGKYVLVITNAVGQVIKQSQVNVDNDKFVYNMKTGNVAKGNYQLTVINEVGEKSTMAFIVR